MRATSLSDVRSDFKKRHRRLPVERLDLRLGRIGVENTGFWSAERRLSASNQSKF